MTEERTIVVGDIHGCLTELHELFIKMNYQPQLDQLICVGDLINRGPHSFEVLQEIRRLNAMVVMGNHERGFLRYLQDGSYPTKEFAQLRQEMGAEVEEWVQWINQMPPFLEFPEFMVVHAGLAPGQHPSHTDARILTTIRTWDGKGDELNQDDGRPWFHDYSETKLVIFGHWASQGLVLRSNVIGLDTGCVYGGALTAVVLPERQIISVPAHQVYCEVL